MFKIKEKAKVLYEKITYPDGLDEEYDQLCDDAFLRLLDRISKISWGFFTIFSIISLYLFITKELL